MGARWPAVDGTRAHRVDDSTGRKTRDRFVTCLVASPLEQACELSDPTFTVLNMTSTTRPFESRPAPGWVVDALRSRVSPTDSTCTPDPMAHAADPNRAQPSNTNTDAATIRATTDEGPVPTHAPEPTQTPVPTHAPVPTEGRVSTDAALASIAGVLDRIDHGARGTIEPVRRLALVDAARTVRRRVEALLVTLVAEANAAEASLKARGTPTTSWLALEAATSGRDAAGLVFAGTQVSAHPDVRDAALSGRLGLKQARAVAEAINDLPEGLESALRARITETLLERAERAHADQVPRIADQVLGELAPPSAVEDAADAQRRKLDQQARRAKQRRALTFFPPIQGSVKFHGNLPVLDAAPFIKLIDAYVERDRRDGRDRARDRLHPEARSRTPEQRRADALLALVAGHSTSANTSKPRHSSATATESLETGRSLPVQQPRTGGAPSRHDAPGRVARLPQLHTDSRTAQAGAPGVAGDRPRIVVVMREAELRERAEQAGLLSNGQPISAGDLRRLCCDADLTPVVLGGDSEILDVGRTQRLVTPAIRQALSLRDGGCTFPGCDAPDEQCEAHHEVPWHAGGRTALATTLLLCPHHHAMVEPPRFSTSGHPPDRWQVRLTDGHPEFIPPQRIDPAQEPIPGRRRGALHP